MPRRLRFVAYILDVNFIGMRIMMHYVCYQYEYLNIKNIIINDQDIQKFINGLP